jgi:hypothetical protein
MIHLIQKGEGKILLHCSRLRLSDGLCVSFVKKLFFYHSVFERAGITLLQFDASGALQSNGNNHTQLGCQ